MTGVQTCALPISLDGLFEPRHRGVQSFSHLGENRSGERLGLRDVRVDAGVAEPMDVTLWEFGNETYVQLLNVYFDIPKKVKEMTDINQIAMVEQNVKKALESAIANAENNHGLEPDNLVVAEAYVGDSLVMKRFMARGRGKSARVEKPFSNLTIVVRQVEETA